MPRWPQLLFILPLVLSTSMLCIGGTKASAQERCLVADPTGTPLNISTAPNGRITQTLTNGVLVMIFDRSSVRGKTWVYVGRYEDRVPIGWVYSGYLDCNVQDHPPFNRHEAAQSEPDQESRRLPANRRERASLLHLNTFSQTITLLRTVEETQYRCLIRRDNSRGRFSRDRMKRTTSLSSTRTYRTSLLLHSALGLELAKRLLPTDFHCLACYRRAVIYVGLRDVLGWT